MASKSEVEFVFETTSGQVVPVEVKSGKNTGAKSVRSFAGKYRVPYVIKASAKNFGFENGVKSLPLCRVCPERGGLRRGVDDPPLHHRRLGHAQRHVVAKDGQARLVDP